MRRTVAVLACAAALVWGGSASALPPVPVSPVVPDLPGTAVMSPNVHHLGTIPLEGVGVSMRTVKVGKQVRAFVSGAGGLSIYDATDPRRPLLLGHLPVYNWENEDIAVAKDGRTAILTEFTATFYLHVIDVSDPSLPVVEGTLPLQAAHTVECVDVHCQYAFGAEGETFDLRDKTHPVQVPAARSWGVLTGAGAGHNLHLDAGGYWISDTMPLVMFKVGRDPFHLTVLTKGEITRNTQYQHNNVRPRADLWRPRPAGVGYGAPYRPGEILLGEGETNFKYSCDGASGAFSTWSVAGFDKHQPMHQLDVLRPVTGPLGSSNPAFNVMGCSGHWFTQRDGKDGSILVAAGWYEHGTRFLSVNPRTGKITQIGYYQPQRGATSAAYWMGSNTVWAVDYHSGIDILTFDESSHLRPSTAAINASWLATPLVDPFSQALRDLCRAGAQATDAERARVHALMG